MNNSKISSKYFKIKRNWFGYYTMFFALFFTIGISAAFINFNFSLFVNILFIILLFRILVYGNMDYILSKKFFICNGIVVLKWGWIKFKLNPNDVMVRDEDLYTYSRATSYRGVVLYRNRNKILKFSFKNRIKLIGGISENEINSYLKTLHDYYDLNVAEKFLD